METFEETLAKATAPETRKLLGAIGLVVNSTGTTLYQHAAGFQSLSPDAPVLDPDSTVALASAGKFITHIAALQLVERGILALDAPVQTHLPELTAPPLITREAVSEPCKLHPLTVNKITLRHLLLHTSGLSSPDVSLIREYLADDSLPKPSFPEDAHYIVKNFFLPLVFEPGMGFAYGYSIHWTQLLVGRASGIPFTKYIHDHIFSPLGMTSSTYLPQDIASIYARRLHAVERDPQSKALLPADEFTQGLTVSISDFSKLFVDLLSPSPSILSSTKSLSMLFSPQFPPGSIPLMDLRSDSENYSFVSGPCMPGTGKPPEVNWTAMGLIVERGMLEGTGMPEGTVTWQGIGNVVWSVNRAKGLAMVFATQLVPVDDEATSEVMSGFFQSAWRAFG